MNQDKYKTAFKNLDNDQKSNLTNFTMLVLLSSSMEGWAQKIIEPFTVEELQSAGWSKQRCLPAPYTAYQPAKKVRNKAAAAAAAEAENEDEEVGKAPPFMPGAKRLLAVAASRESFRKGSSANPLYGSVFYTNVSKALITANFVTTSFDRTMQITKQFYQTNQGREWRVKLAGLKTDGSTETAALEAIHADTTKKRKRS